LGLLSQQRNDEAQALLDQIVNDPDQPDAIRNLMQAVVTILNGSQDMALADGPVLDYDDAAEVIFLIDRLKGKAQQ
jgi:hypothetical protein